MRYNLWSIRFSYEVRFEGYYPEGRGGLQRQVSHAYVISITFLETANGFCVMEKQRRCDASRSLDSTARTTAAERASRHKIVLTPQLLFDVRYQIGVPSLSRKRKVSLPRVTSRAKMVSTPSNCTFMPTTVTTSPLLKTRS